MRIRLKDTSICNEIKTSLATNSMYDWDVNDTEPMYTCLFVSIAKFLGYMKTKDGAGKTTLSIDDSKGNMLVAAMVTYEPNETENMPGNWSFSFTFDPEDIKDANRTYKSNDDAFHKIMSDTTLSLIHYRFVNTMFQEDITKLCIQMLMACLDKNATPEESYEIELPDIFIAKVAVEDDHKVMAIEPSANISRLIKGDEDIEV